MENLNKELERVYNQYPIYQRLLEQKGVTKLKDVLTYCEDPNSWGMIDIPSTLLKMQVSKGAFLKFSNSKLKGGWYLSSSTLDGGPTAIYLSKKDFQNTQQAYKKAYDKVADADYGLWFTPDENFQRMRTKDILIEKNPTNPFSIVGTYAANEKVMVPIFLVQFDLSKGKLDINSLDLVNTLKESLISRKKGIIGGFILHMYYPIIRLAEKGIELDGFSVITGGGGYSGRKGLINLGRRIYKTEFYEILNSISIKNYIDTYGTTENRTAFSGYFDKSLCDHRYTVPETVKLIAVNQETSEPVKVGDLGTPIIASSNGCEANALVISRQDGDLIRVLSKYPDKTVKEFTNITRLPSAHRTISRALSSRVRAIFEYLNL